MLLMGSIDLTSLLQTWVTEGVPPMGYLLPLN